MVRKVDSSRTSFLPSIGAFSDSFSCRGFGASTLDLSESDYEAMAREAEATAKELLFKAKLRVSMDQSFQRGGTIRSRDSKCKQFESVEFFDDDGEKRERNKQREGLFRDDEKASVSSFFESSESSSISSGVKRRGSQNDKSNKVKRRERIGRVKAEGSSPKCQQSNDIQKNQNGMQSSAVRRAMATETRQANQDRHIVNGAADQHEPRGQKGNSASHHPRRPIAVRDEQARAASTTDGLNTALAASQVERGSQDVRRKAHIPLTTNHSDDDIESVTSRAQQKVGGRTGRSQGCHPIKQAFLVTPAQAANLAADSDSFSELPKTSGLAPPTCVLSNAMHPSSMDGIMVTQATVSLNLPHLMCCTLKRRSEDTAMGLRLCQTQDGAIQVARIQPGGPASRTPLQSGCEILSMNGHRIRDAERCVEMMNYYASRRADVRIVASTGPRPRGSSYVMAKRKNTNMLGEALPPTSPYGSFHGLVLEEHFGCVCISGFRKSGLLLDSRIKKGDILLSLDGCPLNSIDDYQRALGSATHLLVYLLIYRAVGWNNCSNGLEGVK